MPLENFTIFRTEANCKLFRNFVNSYIGRFRGRYKTEKHAVDAAAKKLGIKSGKTLEQYADIDSIEPQNIPLVDYIGLFNPRNARILSGYGFISQNTAYNLSRVGVYNPEHIFEGYEKRFSNNGAMGCDEITELMFKQFDEDLMVFELNRDVVEGALKQARKGSKMDIGIALFMYFNARDAGYKKALTELGYCHEFGVKHIWLPSETFDMDEEDGSDGPFSKKEGDGKILRGSNL